MFFSTKKFGMYFCNKLLWKNLPPSDSFTNLYSIDDKYFAAFIIEEFGSADGVTRNFMTKLALENAAKAAGINVNQVIQHFIEEQEINDLNITTVAYSAGLDGVSFIFLNNLYVTETVTAQAIIYTIGDKTSPKLLNLNKELINNLFFIN